MSLASSTHLYSPSVSFEKLERCENGQSNFPVAEQEKAVALIASLGTPAGCLQLLLLQLLLLLFLLPLLLPLLLLQLLLLPLLLQLLRLLLLLVLLLLLSSHKASAKNSAGSSFQAGASLASNNGQVLPGLGRSDLYHEEKDFLDLLSGHPCPPGQPSDQQEDWEEADLPCWNVPDQWL